MNTTTATTTTKALKSYTVTYRRYDRQEKAFYGQPMTTTVKATCAAAAKSELYKFYGGAFYSGIKVEEVILINSPQNHTY